MTKPFIPIKPKYIPKGVKLCIDNANRLIDDASLLYKDGKYPSSIVCSILAFEEIAKARMLRSKWSKGKNVMAVDWKKLTHHLSKSKYGFRFLHENTLLIKSPKFKEIQTKMVETKARESTQDKETFSFVNWTGQGWTSPMFPEPLQIDSDKIKRLKNWSNERLSQSKQSLLKFTQEERTKKILDIRITEYFDPYKTDNFLGKIHPENSLSIKELKITSGEIVQIIINNKIKLTEIQQKSAERLIRKKFPFIQKLEFITSQN